MCIIFSISLIFSFDFSAWDQSDKFVKFYLTGLKGVKELSSESCAFQKLTPTTVNFKVSNLEGKNHVFEILNLPHEILPEKSHFKVKTGW